MKPVAGLVEENLAEWVLAKAASLNDVEIHRDPDVSWTFTLKPAPGNTAVLARFTVRSVDTRIAAVLDKSLQHQLACNWVVGPLSQPVSLGSALRNAGFHCMIHCAGMACDLSLVPTQVPPLRQDVTIEQTLHCPAFEPPTTERRKRTQAIRDGLAALEPRRVWHFAAILDNQAIGRTTLFIGAGVAGIYDVEVLKHTRFRGVGTALVHAALQQAIALGHRYAVLAATGAGFGVYTRLGFREVTRISFWRYGKMRQQQS